LEYAIDGVNFQANNTFSSLINGAYTVTVRVVETGCSTTETINVSCACTAPTLTVADPAPICQNASNNATIDLTTSVTSNTGTSPTYYTTLALANAGGASDVVNPTAVSSGTYYVRSNNTADPTCFTVEPITVTINALPTPNINAVEPICEGESITLTATGGTAYVWSSGGGNAATATYNSLNTTTTYTVTATDANTCSATATATVTVQNCGCVTPAAPTAVNPNEAICAGETLPTFTATPASNTAINWYDAPNGGNLIGTGNAFTPTVAGTYYAEAINIPADACQSSRVAFVLIINQLPIALFILDEVICTNQATTISFNGTPTPNATYAWAIEDNTPQTGNTATATWATTGQKDVTLTVTTDAGCTTQTTQSIGVSDVTASTIADQSIILGSSIALPVTAQSGLQGALSYTWTPTDGSLSCNDCINPQASPTQTTTYTILVADEFGCQTTDNVTVAVMQENTLIIPNAFSPNNDGTNDVFHINGANIAEFTMAIFDRWGQKVYETKATNLNEGWNGLYPDGKTAELGVYVYQISRYF
jgi:gliding motility-associated-like protein